MSGILDILLGRKPAELPNDNPLTEEEKQAIYDSYFNNPEIIAWEQSQPSGAWHEISQKIKQQQTETKQK
jgi:hypothetical protein